MLASRRRRPRWKPTREPQFAARCPARRFISPPLFFPAFFQHPLSIFLPSFLPSFRPSFAVLLRTWFTENLRETRGEAKEKQEEMRKWPCIRDLFIFSQFSNCVLITRNVSGTSSLPGKFAQALKGPALIAIGQCISRFFSQLIIPSDSFLLPLILFMAFRRSYWSLVEFTRILRRFRAIHQRPQRLRR